MRRETVAPNDGIILDVMESQNAAATISSITRRGYAQGFSALATGILSASTGTAAVIARRNGVLLREWTSVNNTQGSSQSAAFPWPIGNDWTTHPAALRYPTRWNFEALLTRVGVQLTCPFGFYMMCGTAPAHVLVGSLIAGLGVYSRADINAGRWTVVVAPRGMAAVGFDTGIAAATPIAVRIVYEDAETPRCWVEVNGTVFGLTTGIANMPACADASPASERPFLTAVQGAPAASAPGQVDRLSQVRVWAQELGSMA